MEEFRFAKNSKWQHNGGLPGARVDSQSLGSRAENRPLRYRDCL